MLPRLVRALAGTALLGLPTGLAPPSMEAPPAGLAVSAPRAPLFPGSRAVIRIDGVRGLTRLLLLGPGRLDRQTYVAPDNIVAPSHADIVVASRGASGRVELQLAPWPRERDVIAVAAYDDGVAFHRARDGRLLGVLALDGGVADVAQIGGSLVAPSAGTDVLWSIDIATGRVHAIHDVPAGNEVLGFGGDAYVTNRDIAGVGALTRVHAGTVTRVTTGVTAEGLSLDPARRIAYVGNVNDGTVAAVGLDSMRVVRRLAAPERAFGVLYDAAERRLDVVSNVPQTQTRPGGTVVSIDTQTGRVGARSTPFRFPLGIVLDAPRRRLFVTDEALGTVAVLDARTLAPVHRPLHACEIAWRPAIDTLRGVLYVPCARANALAAFDLRTLRALPGSPYATAAYPLAVAALRPWSASPLRRVPSR